MKGDGKMKSEMELKGKVRVTERDARTGRILAVHETGNLIVTAGKNHVADLLIGASTASFNYIGVGSSTQAPAASDTDLITPISPRKQCSDRFRSNNVASFTAFFGSADNNGTWNECGLFTALTGGVMLCRALFSSTITKDATKTETVQWDITCG
jgi:hypothetical protein